MLVDALGELHRVLALDVAQHGGEFLAAKPTEQVGRTDGLARALGEYLQHAVADRMAEAVVDRLEVIEVHQQHRDLRSCLRAAW